MKRQRSRGLSALVWIPAGVAALLTVKWVLVAAILLAGPYALWRCVDAVRPSRRRHARWVAV